MNPDRNEDPIEALLQGRYRDPGDGALLSVPVKSVVIENSLAGMEAELVSVLELGRRLAVVFDPETRTVLGDRVAGALSSIAKVETVALPSSPHADQDTVDQLRAATRSADALIAVGSGVINDLCKRAAAEAQKPYAVFATAPSMNGYTSVTAAISVDGHKKSLPAMAPAGVFMDLSVFAAAPPRMIRSGLGDSLCRCTAQADWLLAQALFDAPYRETPFALLAGDEAALFDAPEALLRGDLEAMGRLARTLVLSGFGMTLCGGSEPASQGEHLIAHYGEMMADPRWPQSFHGEQIGVTTLTMARLQWRMIADEPPALAAERVSEPSLRAHFGEQLGATCWRELEPKRVTGENVEARNQRLQSCWPALAEKIRRVLISSGKLEAVLTRAGAPLRAADLGWPEAFYRGAVGHAREIRNRYTFLDLAASSGVLDDFIDEFQ